MIHFFCEKCSNELESPSSMAGQIEKCSNCGSDNRVPADSIVLLEAVPVGDGQTGPVEPRDISPAGPAATDAGAATTAAPAPPVEELPKAGAPDQPAEVYPWEIQPELVDRIAAYEEQGIGSGFIGGVSEKINGVLRREMVDKQMLPGQVNVYPDLVTASEPEEKPGFLIALILALPEPLQMLLMPFLWALRAFDSLVSLGIVLVMMAIVIALIVFLWYIMIPAAVLLLAAFWLYGYLRQKQLANIAARIRQDPDSPYAVKKMQKLSPLYPRAWQRGQIVQLLRADVRFGLRKRSMVILVMHQPHPPGPGGIFITKAVGLLWSRWMKPQRRLYVLSMHKEDHADQAAEAIGKVMGLQITPAKFSMGRLKVAAE